MSRPDEELIAEIPHDEAAFSAFYRRHVHEVLGFLQRRTGDPELAADLTAEVFATVVAEAKRFDPERASGRTWLYMLVRRKQVDAYRRSRAERAAIRRFGVRHVAVSAEDRALIEALGSTVETLVEELPDDQRAAVSGRVLEDLSYAELAHRQGVTQATVRQRVARGLAAVRTRMEDR